MPPCWEAKTDWKIFQEIAKATSAMAKRYLPEPVQDFVCSPLLHDTPGEITQPRIRDWAKGECEAIPGKTMPNMTVVERDYTKVYQKFISLGRNMRNNGIGVHGCTYKVDDLYDAYLLHNPIETWGGEQYPSLRIDRSVCEAILHFAAETNGELAHRAYEAESHKTGIDHSHLAAGNRNVRYTFADLCTQPRRLLTTPFWTGITNGARTYSAYCQNLEERIPWRTLLFATTGIGDGSTFRMIAVIFPKELAGPVLGWTSAVAAYRAFLIPTVFAMQIKAGKPEYALYGFAVHYMSCLALNWWYYARKNAEVSC